MSREKNRILGLGKVPKEALERSVFPFLPLTHKPELDGGVLQSSGEMVVSHSPSVGVPLPSLGFFGFHYSASNVASKFAIPVYLVIGIYLPLKTRECELATIAKGLGDEARKYNVKVVAGQTATYRGIETPLLTTTCLGEQTRKPLKLEQGDSLQIVGKIGSEAVWLQKASEGIEDRDWRRLTPLPVALALHKVKGIKLMHDVSEGGVKNALYELMESTRTKILFDSDRAAYDEEVKHLGVDALSLPSYGSLIVVSKTQIASTVSTVCDELGVKCSLVGKIEEGLGLFIDGDRVDRPDRLEFDQIYGSFTSR